MLSQKVMKKADTFQGTGFEASRCKW